MLTLFNFSQAESFEACELEVNVSGFAQSICAKSKVPLDHAGHFEGTVELAVRKFPTEPATERRGQV